MAGEDIYSWSKVASDNGSADALINWVEGQPRASVNNSARSMMAAHAKNRNLLNGSIVTFGTANDQQFLSGGSYTVIPTGMIVKLKVGSGLTNTASTTLNMDSIGATLIKTANGDSLLGGEFVSDGYVDLLYNGTNWIFLYGREFMFDRITSGGGIIIGHQRFTASGTYTPTAGMECCFIECVGGGAGGGSSSSVDVNQGSGGGGGGAGGYSRTVATAADIGATQNVTVGAAGIGVGVDGASGTNGAVTSVGTLCVANGGGGGIGAVATQGSPGGLGGAAGTGGHTSSGENGWSGLGTIATNVLGSFGGHGGNSIWGGGGRDQDCVSQIIGESATGYGSGGAGGASFQGGGGVRGGNGSPGCVIITEFAGKGAPGRDGAPGPIGPVGPSGAGTGDVLRSGTPVAGQHAVWTDASHIQGVAAPAMPQRTVYSTPGTGTYTTPANATWIEVELVGAGGGGASGANVNSGTVGGNTTFGALTGNGGGIFGAIGTASGGDVNISGGPGNQGGNVADGAGFAIGGTGGASYFGGGGGGRYNAAGSNGTTGAGGGGGGTNAAATTQPGFGGGAGGYCRNIIPSPTATYSYAVGAGGTGGAVNAANFAGGNGGSGIIIITAHFGP